MAEDGRPPTDDEGWLEADQPGRPFAAQVRERRRSVVRALALALLVVAVIVVAAGRASVHPHLAAKPGGPPSSLIKPTLVTTNPVIYDFVTASVGWAVETFGRAPGPAGEFRVFKTTDGAKHWQLQLHLGSSFTGFFPISVQFLDQNHGFIGVGDPFEQLNRTTDGGVTWNSLLLPLDSASVDGMAFSDPSHGWLLAGRQVTHLYETLDAGNSWQQLPEPPTGAVGLAVRSPHEAWMGSAGLDMPHVYSSSDAGRSWQRHNLPAPPGVLLNAGVVYLVNDDLLPGAGVLVSASCECTPSGPFDFTSLDGGLSWTYVPPPPGEIAFQDASHWWAMKGTSLSKSSDAGQTWTMVTNALPDWQFVPRIIDSRHAWAKLFVAGGYGLAVTDDGGLHWTRAAVPPS
jgi:photosystem II stability/assembly factor-like uncharacterized protein